MTEAYVRSETAAGICTIEFFHPQSNSLPATILSQLAGAIDEAAKNTEARVVVIRSGGEKTFCSGASFDELMRVDSEAAGEKFFNGFALVINAIRNCPKFVLGRIQGKCVGGGVGIAAAVDYAFAVDTAQVKLSELAVGIGPFVVGPAVARKIGVSAFSQLAINATEWRSAAWAMQCGLFAEVFSDASAMDAAIGRLATTLSASNPEAMAEMKKIFWDSTGNWDHLLKERAAISGRLVLSDFTRNAIEKFKKKD